MSDEPSDRHNHRLCKHLRSKEMFYETGVPLEERCASGIFWCGRTLGCLGPDGAPAARDDCAPKRGCYED